MSLAIARTKVRVASYNILSSALCRDTMFVKCAPENIDARQRIRRIQSKLDTEIEKGSIICLQGHLVVCRLASNAPADM
jgi:mRNA deadenylase 3'-5' endonuclease subunit Ccr4